MSEDDAGRIRSQLDKIVIDNPREDDAHRILDRLLAHAKEQGPGPKRCVQMIGPAQSGKSTIVESYVAKHNTPEVLARREIPIFHVKPDANLTRKGMSENILETFGDYGFQTPPMSGSETTLLRRVRTNVKIAKVRLLVIDDFHHVVHSETKKVAYSVGETVKGCLIKGMCPILMVGVEDARKPLLANHQLALRAEPTIELGPLNLKKDEEKLLFMKFMAKFLTRVDQVGAVANAKTLFTKDVLLMIFRATDGVLGRACNLVKDAITIAVSNGRTYLTVEDLALATDLIFVGMNIIAKNRNPFRQDRAA